MITKKIKYTDYNGVQREENFLFNLSKAELMEMEMGTSGGLTEMIQKIIETQDQPSIIKIFKELVLKAYGEKSADGKRFVKTDVNGNPLSTAFSETEAYSILFMELATDAKAAAAFVNGIIPSDLEQKDFNVEVNGTMPQLSVLAENANKSNNVIEEKKD